MTRPSIRRRCAVVAGRRPFGATNRAVGPAARVGGWYELVNAKGKNVEAAKKYVQWLWIQQAELQKDWCCVRP